MTPDERTELWRLHAADRAARAALDAAGVEQVDPALLWAQQDASSRCRVAAHAALPRLLDALDAAEAEVARLRALLADR